MRISDRALDRMQAELLAQHHRDLIAELKTYQLLQAQAFHAFTHGEKSGLILDQSLFALTGMEQLVKKWPAIRSQFEHARQLYHIMFEALDRSPPQTMH